MCIERELKLLPATPCFLYGKKICTARVTLSTRGIVPDLFRCEDSWSDLPPIPPLHSLSLFLIFYLCLSLFLFRGHSIPILVLLCHKSQSTKNSFANHQQLFFSISFLCHQRKKNLRLTKYCVFSGKHWEVLL